MLDPERIPSREVLSALPVFPLPNAVLLPGMVLPLNVFEPRYLEMVDHALENGEHLGVPLLQPGFENDYEGRPDFEPVFGVGKILSHLRLPDGRRFIRIEGLGRARMERELDNGRSFREVAADGLPERRPDSPELTEVLKAQVERIAGTLEDDDGEMVRCVLRIPDARVLVYAVTAIIPTLGLTLPDPPAERAGRCPHLDLQQQCLNAKDTDGRIRLLLERTSNICDVLGESGRFPRTMLN